jgi:hypothetical protein
LRFCGRPAEVRAGLDAHLLLPPLGRNDVRLCLLLTLVIGFASAASEAQIVKLHLKDAKAAKRYKKQVRYISGKPFLIGEPKSGFTIKGRDMKIDAAPKAVEIYVIDSAKPEKVPYKFKRGEKVPASKKGYLSVPKADLDPRASASFFNDRQTILGLATEHELNLSRLAEIEAKRDAAKKGSKDWIDWQRRGVSARRRMVAWLVEFGYDKAVKKFERDLKSEEKRLKDDGIEARRSDAVRSVESVDIPAALAEAQSKIGGGRLSYRSVRSKHLVVWYPKSVPDASMKKAIETCELVIEGFRREFADRWIGEDFPDWIPDERFACFLFVPEETSVIDQFWTEFMGQSWGRNKEQSMKMGVNGCFGAQGYARGSMCRIQEPLDLEGMLVYLVAGHLADYHFAGPGRSSQAVPWIKQGLQYYLCFEFLGRNIMTSFEWKEREYASDPGREGIKTVELGQRAAFNAVAVKLGEAFSSLAVKDLYRMDDPDLAKCWSFYDFLARQEPEKINAILRSACRHWGRASRKSSRQSGGEKGRGAMLTEWREDLRAILELPKSEDPLNVLDKRWKEYASGEQRKDRGIRKR